MHLLPVTVCEHDALRGHFTVDDGGGRLGIGRQRLTDGFGNGLRASQGLHIHRANVEHVGRWKPKSRNHHRFFSDAGQWCVHSNQKWKQWIM